MTTDTSERGLERLICTALTGEPAIPAPPEADADQRATGGLGLGVRFSRRLRPRVLRRSGATLASSWLRRSPKSPKA